MNDQATSSKSYARPLLSRLFRWAYGRTTPRVRRRIATLPGVLPFYKRTLKPLLFPTTPEDGLASVSFPGFMMYVDPKDIMGEMAMGADWETVTTHIFRQVIRPGDVVIDIGAHWGYFTLLAATLCTDAGKVYAFEPHPENFAMLTKNIAANQLSNVVAIQKAISDCQGEARLFQAQASMGHSLYHLPQDSRVAKDSPPVTISISTVRLDDFFAADSIRPRLIKMDIEGAEPSALEGMQGLIKRSSELVLITEFNFQFLDSNTAARFLETLTALGFEIAILDEERVQIKVPPPEEIMGELLQPETGHVINLVCVRGRELTQRLLETQQLRGGRIPAAKVTAHH